VDAVWGRLRRPMEGENLLAPSDERGNHVPSNEGGEDVFVSQARKNTHLTHQKLPGEVANKKQQSKHNQTNQ